ncbi:MAG TPA: VWA domain-containing protein [Kofleriaceae bacterium]|nr:VWA domain-containing protein [Kofleriaceae bacterium]
MIGEDWTWKHGGWIHLVWAVLALMAVLVVLELRGRDALARFLSPRMQRRLAVKPSLGRSIARLSCIAVSLLAGVAALMRPQAPAEGETVVSLHAAADIMVVLDVSRSMLAEDVAPDRLTRAKAEIAGMARQLAGHRLGLIAFAGRASPRCALTPDQSYFNLALRGVDTRSAGKGGTRIGEAVRAALRGFPKSPGAKLIVLITDGEDQDSNPLQAAQLAKEQGVKIVAVGLGSEQGSPIVLTDPQTGAKTELTYDGKPVISRLDGDTLRQMALMTGGVYVPAGTSALDLESIVKQNISPILRAAADSQTKVIPAERYPWMVGLALLALLAAVAVGSRAGRSS